VLQPQHTPDALLPSLLLPPLLPQPMTVLFVFAAGPRHVSREPMLLPATLPLPARPAGIPP